MAAQRSPSCDVDVNEILSVVDNPWRTAGALFGSVARGDAGPGSDIDFLVELKPGAACSTSAGC